MKNLKNQFGLIIALVLASSCTEEISQEVKNGENLTTEQSELAKFQNKYLRLANTSDPNLEYILHKSGSMQEACELKSPKLGFSSLNYKKDDPAVTVDCILDAKEYDLFFSGTDLEVQVDANLCEYVSYAPYRFFQYLPGTSAKTQYQVLCDATCAQEHPSICDKKFRTQNSVPPIAVDPAILGTYFESNISDAAPLTCEFDYSQDIDEPGPNCDDGNIRTISYALQAGNKLDADGNDVPSCQDDNIGLDPQIVYLDTTEVKCEGKNNSCLAGPGNDILPFDKNRVVYQNLELGSFNKEINIKSPFSKGYLSNVYISNFSRVCSSTSAVKDNNVLFDTALNSLKGFEIEDLISRKAYQTYGVDEDGDGSIDYYPQGKHLFDARASEKYPNPSSAIKPYYGIYCLDKARDVKAQIRLFIREWDRDFNSSNIYIGKLSDINQSTSLMDSFGEQPDANCYWNDFRDLDDFLADYDRSPEVDANGDGKDFDNAFYKNQCSGLVYGFCENAAFDNQNDCELGSSTWRVHSYCSNNRSETNSTDCVIGGGTWININKDQLFPGKFL